MGINWNKLITPPFAQVRKLRRDTQLSPHHLPSMNEVYGSSSISETGSNASYCENICTKQVLGTFSRFYFILDLPLIRKVTERSRYSIYQVQGGAAGQS